MIISVGGTHEPIIKSIREFKPEFISFVASQESCKDVIEIEEKLASEGFQFRRHITLVDNINELFECHAKAEIAVKKVLEEGYKKDDIRVDYTGGTKNMSVAVSLASITHGFSFAYVGGKREDNKGIVIDGAEEVFVNVNPWEVLAIDEKRKVALLFNKYQYKAAKEIVDTLCDKIIKKRNVFRNVGLLLEGYSMWDQFDYKEALEKFKRANVEDLILDDDPFVKNLAGETRKRLELLDRLVASSKVPRKILAHDIFANAERRYKEGKIDSAMIRIYRIVEITAQDRLLNKYGIETNNVDLRKIKDEKLKRELLEKHKDRDGKIKIGQEKAFKVLLDLKDEWGKLYFSKANFKKFIGIRNSRNQSYLTHGFQTLKSETYDALKQFIVDLKFIDLNKVPAFPEIKID